MPEGSSAPDAGISTVQTITVLAIIALLVYLALPVWDELTERTRTQSCQSNQRSIAEAIDLARTDRVAGQSIGYFDAVLEPGHDWGRVLIPVYLSKAPVCPVSGQLYFMSPLGRIWSDQGAGQYTFVNQGLENDHRLVGQ